MDEAVGERMLHDVARRPSTTLERWLVTQGFAPVDDVAWRAPMSPPLHPHAHWRDVPAFRASDGRTVALAEHAFGSDQLTLISARDDGTMVVTGSATPGPWISLTEGVGDPDEPADPAWIGNAPCGWDAVNLCATPDAALVAHRRATARGTAEAPAPAVLVDRLVRGTAHGRAGEVAVGMLVVATALAAVLNPPAPSLGAWVADGLLLPALAAGIVAARARRGVPTLLDLGVSLVGLGALTHAVGPVGGLVAAALVAGVGVRLRAHARPHPDPPVPEPDRSRPSARVALGVVATDEDSLRTLHTNGVIVESHTVTSAGGPRARLASDEALGARSRASHGLLTRWVEGSLRPRSHRAWAEQVAGAPAVPLHVDDDVDRVGAWADARRWRTSWTTWDPTPPVLLLLAGAIRPRALDAASVEGLALTLLGTALIAVGATRTALRARRIRRAAAAEPVVVVEA